MLDARVTIAVLAVLLLEGCATTANPEFVKKFAVEQQTCYDTGKLKYFGKQLTNLDKADCDDKINVMAKELERYYDPAFEAANKAQEDNFQKAKRIMDAYSTLQQERVKAGEISQERAKALVRLKLEEVTADMTKANNQIADNYGRRNASRRSLSCMTTSSSNSAFTTCN